MVFLESPDYKLSANVSYSLKFSKLILTPKVAKKFPVKQCDLVGIRITWTKTK